MGREAEVAGRLPEQQPPMAGLIQAPAAGGPFSLRTGSATGCVCRYRRRGAVQSRSSVLSLLAQINVYRCKEVNSHGSWRAQGEFILTGLSGFENRLEL